ncbi:helix-turn-helix transcriptional regulator [Bacillus atrophaeus]|uniref:helix-turn-helix domain-containing protein n=1 Tax=Bacillus atrophaeus TaxID=1452 RepID=UPI002E2185C3|nr:helix-turn-helix transcriptional regulator [Bacillus atrophaeus]
MVDFSPLYQTLKEKGMKPSRLRECVSPDTQAKIKKQNLTSDATLYLGTIDTICQFLDVPIEKVVRILPDEVEK